MDVLNVSVFNVAKNTENVVEYRHVTSIL